MPAEEWNEEARAAYCGFHSVEELRLHIASTAPSEDLEAVKRNRVLPPVVMKWQPLGVIVKIGDEIISGFANSDAL